MSEQLGAPRVAVVIVNYRTPELALRAAASLECERAALPGLRVVIADGGSGDGSAEKLAEGVKDPALAGWVEALPLAINGGFGWANNQAMLRLMQGEDAPEFIYILNPDTLVEPGAAMALAEHLRNHPRAGAAGSLLLHQDFTPSGSAFRFYSPWSELVRGARMGKLGRLLGIPPTLIVSDVAVEADWATGASVMFRAAALRESGLFDTGFFLYYEEGELMWRMRKAGWSVWFVPESRVRHIGGASTGLAYNRKDLKIGPALPRYWFASRRRMFARTRGRGATVQAGLLWLAGHWLFLLRRAIGGVRDERPSLREARDFLAYGLAPNAQDLTPHIARWDDAPDQPPAWMKAQ